jgi:hypothetical protein
MKWSINKKITAVFFTCLLAAAPLFAVYKFYRYYARYDEIARKYECYPFANCNADFNQDGIRDWIETVYEPKNGEHNYRLKFFLNNKGQTREILNIRYENTDGSFRTHVALLEEQGISKVVIYDTNNQGQYYYWDGQRLSLTERPSPVEMEIRTAMGLRDDTGRAQILQFELLGIPVLGLYYLLLAITIGCVVHYRRKLNAGYFEYRS